MSKEKKVVALIRRHMKALAECPYGEIDAATANLGLAQEAARRSGLEELCHAVMDYDQLSTKVGREIIFNYLDDPMAYLERANNRIEKFKEYLK